MMTIATIARVAHEVNKAYCESIGDTSQKSWEEAEQWQRDSAIKGVEFALNNPSSTPESQHEAWCQDKLSQGWKLGPVKDAEKKEHHCLVPYSELPPEQRVKDYLFKQVVNSMRYISEAPEQEWGGGPKGIVIDDRKTSGPEPEYAGEIFPNTKVISAKKVGAKTGHVTLEVDVHTLNKVLEEKTVAVTFHIQK